jgi:hypothetical protein
MGSRVRQHAYAAVLHRPCRCTVARVSMAPGAIIACMLVSLWTGKKPTLRTYEMICWYFIGVADLEELLEHIAKLKKPAA